MASSSRCRAAFGALFIAACGTASDAYAGGGGLLPVLAGQLSPNDPTTEFLSARNARITAVNGDTAALVIHKAEFATPANIMHGQVYVYQRVGGAWSVQAVLTPSNPADSIHYGRSIALQGDTLVVGVDNPVPDVGFTAPPPNPTLVRGAYVYQRQGGIWVEKARLIGSDALTSTYDFGAEVAVSGPTITIGASGGPRWLCTTACTLLERRAGATYVFDQNATGGWTQTARIATNSQIGGSAGLSGDTLAVPDIQSLGNGRFVGRVIVYQRAAGVWTRQAVLTAADQTPAAALLSTTPPAVSHGLFSGTGSITTPAIDGDTMLVAGSDTSSKGDIRGNVYVFKRTGVTWRQEAKIIPKSSKPNDGFGFRLSLSGASALAGTFSPTVSLLQRGAAGWTETPIQSPGVESRRHVDLFGLAIALDRTTALITQPYTRELVYALPPAP